MLFPYIAKIDDILPYIEHNPQFRVQVQPNGYTVICYMLQDEDTFKGEHEEYAKECRGITFDVHGRIASRTLHKFENVGQSSKSMPENIPWDRIVRVMDKRDGSMITFVDVDGKITAKTKKTFTSNEALAATEFLYKDPMRVEWVAAMLKLGYTPTFEWTSPRFPIVLTYRQDALTLLHVRHNTSGVYVSEHEMKNIFMPMNRRDLFPIVENMLVEFSREFYAFPGMVKMVDWSMFKEAAETREGIEGWIIQADTGEMWKIKTLWYVKLHHAVTFTRWRDIARTVLADGSDDLKAAFTMTSRSLDPIIQVEHVIHEAILAQETMIGEIVEAGFGLDAKAMAAKHISHPHFGQIMSTFRGKTIDFRAWYLKDHIRDWSLEVIVQNEDIEVPDVEEV